MRLRMARTKKSRLTQSLIKAEARDRKKYATNRMKVSGKGVFLLGRVSSSASKSRKKD